MAMGPTDKDILRDAGEDNNSDVANDQPDYDNGFETMDEVGQRGGSKSWDDPSMADDSDTDDLDNDLPYQEEDEDTPMDEGVA